MENQNQYYNLLLAKKTEKLVSAIYLISQFLKDIENIKIEIRTEANQLLKNINLLAYDEDIENYILYKNTLDNITILISYLSIAKDTNLISKMNSEIVIDSLRALENILIKKQFTFKKDNLSILEEDLFTSLASEKKNEIINKNTSFDVLTERNIKSNLNESKLNTNKNLEKDIIIKKDNNIDKIIKDKSHKGQIIKDNIQNTLINNEKIIIKSISSTDNKKVISSNLSNNKTKQNKDRKDNRRDQILALFTKGIEVSINDISKKIIGCSVKTIQRELNDLVIENKLRKIGEKRWSKYVLNN